MIGGVSFSELHYFVYIRMLGGSQLQSEFSSIGETVKVKKTGTLEIRETRFLH